MATQPDQPAPSTAPASPTAGPGEVQPATETAQTRRGGPPSDQRPTLPAGKSGGRRLSPFPGSSRYLLVAELARGGMGVVYRVHDSTLGRDVALKMIRDGDGAGGLELHRFLREARAVARLSHPHIVEVYDFGELQGQPYFTMRLAEGGCLEGRLPAFAADPRAAAVLLEKVARAVHHAHERKVLHRDLKPSNILLDASGEPLVSDFGLAKFFGDGRDLTQTGQNPGTPAYMAPEQARGRTDLIGPCTDIWALGVVLFELLTGQRPFAGGNREELLHRILTTDPPRPRSLRPGLDPALEAVALRCLRREPADRYPSAAALADQLGSWLRGGRPSRGRRRLIGLMAAGCLVAGVPLTAAALLPPPGRAPGPDPTREGRGRRSLILVGERGRPGKFRWVAGKADSAPGIDPRDGAFTIRTAKLALLELLPAPPWPRYRLEAEVRHDAPERGEAGIYFAQRSYPSVAGEQHAFCGFGFADKRGGRANIRVWLWDGFPSHAGLGVIAPVRPPWGQDRGADGYRSLAVEVRAASVVAAWEGRPLEEVPTFKVRHRLVMPGGFQTIPWESIDDGGLGIYLYGGTASFRRVALSPLD